MRAVRRAWKFAAIVIVATLTSANAISAAAGSVPPGLLKAAHCMYGVLKREPGFDKPKLGFFEDGVVVLPYVRYLSPPDKRGYRMTVGFSAEQACAAVHRDYNCCGNNSYCFTANLPGLIDTRDALSPPDWGVRVITKEWREWCGVDAYALFN